MVGVEYSSVTAMAKALKKVSPALRRELRPELRKVGETLRGRMRSQAGYSTRIPGAIRMTVSFSSRGGGINLTVDPAKAPHARPLDGRGGTRSSFIHPVYGHPWVVSQATRPFFVPVIEAGLPVIQKGISDAVRASLREVNP